MTKTTIYDAAIIGAGASGLMAAITAARAGAKVLLLEHMDQAGKKILATGNGKCNYTNMDQGLESYYCECPGFAAQVLQQFSHYDTIRFFEELGICPVQKNGTCIYPESGQASSVRHVLLAEVKRLRIPLQVSVGIRSIHKERDIHIHGNFYPHLFVIQTKQQPVYCRNCILSAGGQSAKKTGSDGSGFLYAKQLGHTIQTPLPALVPLLADYAKWKLPAGVRISCAASLYADGKLKSQEQGELQITDYGISGIVIFQFSRIAAKALAQGSLVQVILDWKPEQSEAELAANLEARFSSPYHTGQTTAECMIGFLPDKLIAPVCKRAGIQTEELCSKCGTKRVQKLAALLKNYKVHITGTKSFEASQVTAGGIPVQEIDPESMESKIVPGLYFAGEMIDVDAKCGGYNLQWAWASGYTAGKSIRAAETGMERCNTRKSKHSLKAIRNDKQYTY
ncbi:MAG: NAD(P)/FAD-dependent oxidoreductase [Eubacterium sp.]|nr:NAD(P)/FAD-dependent oxidoreductase [Eubacterium sp.]